MEHRRGAPDRAAGLDSESHDRYDKGRADRQHRRLRKRSFFLRAGTRWCVIICEEQRDYCEVGKRPQWSARDRGGRRCSETA
jgi:hypothetical protein